MWNYRIVELHNKAYPKVKFYQIVEAFYDKKKIWAITDPQEPMGETPEELVECLEMMLKDAKRCLKLNAPMLKARHEQCKHVGTDEHGGIRDFKAQIKCPFKDKIDEIAESIKIEDIGKDFKKKKK